jgi:Cu/Ag efflux protein CusF
MRRATTWAVVISLALSLSDLLAQEQKTGQAQAPKAAARPALRTHSGEVVSVDTTNNRIVIKQRTGKEMTCDVASDARITKARQAITLGNVKPGDRVTTRCDESGGKCLLKSIRVQVARAAARTS